MMVLAWFLRQRPADKLAVGLFAVAMTPIVWTASASSLFIILMGKGFRQLWPFTDLDSYYQWWIYYLDPGQPKRVHLWLAVAGIAAAAPFVAFVLRQVTDHAGRNFMRPFDGGLRPLEPGVTDNHGHAAWATPKQIAAKFSGPGCLIGAMGRGPNAKLIFDDLTRGPGHSMIIAGTGALKTMSAVTRLLHHNGPRVVFDPSIEIGPIMTDALREQGCNVVSVGLTGSGVNVLDWIDIDHPESDAHIRTVTDWIYDENAADKAGQGGHHDPFWPMWGRKLVTCILADMMHCQTAMPKTLARLRRGLATPEDEMQRLLRGIHAASNSAMARDIAGGLMGMRAEQTFSSIYGNAFAATEWLSVRVYADAVSGNAIHTSEILDSNTVVFIQIPLRTLLHTPSVGRAVLAAFFNAMFHADGGLADTILFQIDEAWVLGALKEIKLCHTTARKYRGAVSTMWQSEGQIEGVWGRNDARMLRDTVSWRSYNAVQDGTVAEQLSRDIGEHAVMAHSEGTNDGNQRKQFAWIGSTSRGANTNTHEISRRLIKADEITRAPADVMWILARDFPHPIQAFAAPYFRYPEIARRMGKNRFNRSA